MSRKGRFYTPGERFEAAKLIVAHGTVYGASRHIDIPHSTLKHWYKQPEFRQMCENIKTKADEERLRNLGKADSEDGGLLNGTGDKKVASTAVDGKAFAPAPKYGLLRAIYETIDGLGGATEAQVRKYLPAVVSKSNQIATKKKVHKTIWSGKYRGYFIKDGAYWRIAPLSYYLDRQKREEGLKEARLEKLKKEGLAQHEIPQEAPQEVEPEVQLVAEGFEAAGEVQSVFEAKWLVAALVGGAFWGLTIGFALGAFLL
jgi:hypothetical protein